MTEISRTTPLAPLERQLSTEVETLRRSLTSVKRQAQAALDSLDKGGRASPYSSGSIWNHDLDRALGAASRVDMLLNFAGSELMDAEVATAILKRPVR